MKVLIFFRNLVVLLIVFLSLSSFDNKKNNDKIFKHLSKLYQNDKHRCLEKASKMINPAKVSSKNIRVRLRSRRELLSRE